MLTKNVEKFIKAFEDVSKRGYIVSNRKGNTGIGKTLEDYMDIPENNIDAPDLFGIEIKSQRAYSGSYVTLFTKAPTLPKNANRFLKDTFGTPDQKFPDVKVLHTSIFHNKFNTHKSGHGFKLHCDENKERLSLIVKDLNSEDIVSDEVFWSYDILRNIVNTKLQSLAFITAQTKKENDKELFHFQKCKIYHGTNFDKIMDLIKNDTIMFDIRIGAYKSGPKKGNPHDHGSGFRIKKSNFSDAYDSVIDIGQ